MGITTITVDMKLKRQLDKLKLSPRESYNEVLRRVLSSLHVASVDPESLRETVEILSDPEIMRSLARSVDQLKRGKVYSIDEV